MSDSERDVPTDPAELTPVLSAIDDVRKASEEQTRTIGKALHDLRDTVLEHYHRTTRRLDEHASEIRRIKAHVGIVDVQPPADRL